MQDAILFVGWWHILDRCVQDHRLGAVVHDHSPDPVQKTAHAVNARHAPWLGLFKRSHEHFIESQRIRAVIAYDFVGVNDVASTLRHLVSAAFDANGGIALEYEAIALFFDLV